jgi:hypothetical protein
MLYQFKPFVNNLFVLKYLKASNYSPPNPLKGEKREREGIGDTPMTPAWDSPAPLFVQTT